MPRTSRELAKERPARHGKARNDKLIPENELEGAPAGVDELS
jgi:hypothetical protein